jgi:hypothetical protein
MRPQRPGHPWLTNEIYSLHWPLLLSDKRAQTDNSAGARRAFSSMQDDVAHNLATQVTLKGRVLPKIAIPILLRIRVAKGLRKPPARKEEYHLIPHNCII